jgi:transposase
MLARTFGCVRVVWNRTLAERHARYQAEGKGTSYAESDRALTELKKDPDLAFLNDVSSVPLQQALRTSTRPLLRFSPSAPVTRGLSLGTAARPRPTPGPHSA